MRWVLVGCLVLGVFAVWSPAAAASGDPHLNGEILDNPVPGWTELTGPEMSQMVANLNRDVNRGAPLFGISIATAAKVFGQPITSNLVVIMLFQLSQRAASAKALASDAQEVVRAGIDSSICAQFGNAPSVGEGPMPQIPGSVEAVCSPDSDGFTPSLVTFAKANVAAVIVSQGLNPLQLASVALQQDQRLSSESVNRSSLSNTEETIVIAASIVGGVVLLIVLLSVVAAIGRASEERRLRSRHLAVVGPGRVANWRVEAGGWNYSGATGAGVSGGRSAPAGWYADPLGAAQHRYWDGAAWTGHVR